MLEFEPHQGLGANGVSKSLQYTARFHVLVKERIPLSLSPLTLGRQLCNLPSEAALDCYTTSQNRRYDGLNLCSRLEVGNQQPQLGAEDTAEGFTGAAGTRRAVTA